MNIKTITKDYIGSVKKDEQRIDCLFDNIADQVPNSIAAKDLNNEITYSALKINATHVANAILEIKNSSSIIGVCMERNIGIPQAFLGILKSGKTFLFLDKNLPKSRLEGIIRNAKINTIITSNTTSEIFSDINYITSLQIDKIKKSILKMKKVREKEQEAFIIYTSGTTGKPKGIKILHSAIINNLLAFRKLTLINHNDKILANSSFSFDMSIIEMFCPLISGGLIYITSDENRSNLQEISKIIRENKINVIFGTPTFLKMFLLVNKNREIDYKLTIISGGEKLSIELANELRKRGDLYNIYGPTETTIFATACKITRDNEVPIGKIIDNSVYYISNKLKLVTQPYHTGELLVGGDLLSSGYLNNIKLTKEKFIRNPFEENPSMLYKTGDLVYKNTKGELFYKDRIDRQIKIRGYRVELQEIEKVINIYKDGIESYVCIRRYAGNDHVVAYILANSDDVKNINDNIRRFLKNKLPSYEIPSYFCVLTEVAMTSSGKIDLDALPDPRSYNGKINRTLSTIEQKIHDECLILLGLSEIDPAVNLYEIGANSLILTKLITKLIGLFHCEIKFCKILNNPSITSIAKLIHKSKKMAEPKLPRNLGSSKFPAPLTFQQEQVWFLTKLAPNNLAYNTNFILKIDGYVDKSILEKTLILIVKRHKIFRTKFIERNGVMQQEIMDPWKVDIKEFDLSRFPKNKDVELEKLINNDVNYIFDTSDPPLVFWNLYKLLPNKYVLLQVEHHFVHDGWSFSVLMKELMTIYNALASGKEPKLVDLQIDYADYANWQRTMRDDSKFVKQIQYWENELRAAPPISSFPLDKPRKKIPSFKGDMIQLEIEKHKYSRLRKFSRDNSMSLFTVMFAAYAILLNIYSRQRVLVIGSGFANRKHKQTEHIIGMFVNTLGIKIDFERDETILSFISRVNNKLNIAHENQDIPLRMLIEKNLIEHDASKTPFFQTMFSFHDSAVPLLKLDGSKAKIIVKHNKSSKMDLNVISIPRREQLIGTDDDKDGSLTMYWEYSTDLYKRSTIKKLITHYNVILDNILSEKKMKISEINLLTKKEFYKIVHDWNQPKIYKSNDKSIVQQFEKQVQLTPHNAAVVFEGEQTSYKNLNKKANQLARYIKKINHVDGKLTDSNVPIIAIYMDRSIDMIISILATLKLGFAYQPVPPNYPKQRTQYMLSDSNCNCVLTTKKYTQRINDFIKQNSQSRLICVDKCKIQHEKTTNLSINVNDNELACIFYTSGTSGEPNGVAIEHKSILSLLMNQTYVDFNKKMTILHLSNTAFDASLFEIFGTLLFGGQLVIPKSAKELVSNVNELEKVIIENRVKLLFLTKTLFEYIYFNKETIFKHLNTLITGGEVLNPMPIKKLMKSPNRPVNLLSAYGPTESTTFTTIYNCDQSFTNTVPIGKPIANRKVYVLNKALKPVPANVIGELYISGPGLARGYINSSKLTKKRFILNPFATKSEKQNGYMHLYKTGDLVKWQSSGNLEFIERVDDQVKIRGFRVEISEIEMVLTQHPEINQAKVLLKENFNKRYNRKHLVAYYTSKNSVDSSELTDYLSSKLPDYMTPNFFIRLEALPFTSNGKVDVSQLAESNYITEENITVPPRDKLEQQLCNCWERILNLSKVGIENNFFYIGGNSILAIQAAHEMSRITKTQISVADIFNYKTIKNLPKNLPAKQNNIKISKSIVNPASLSFSQKRLLFIEEYEQGTNAYHISILLELADDINNKIFEDAIHKIVERHSVLRSVFVKKDTGEYFQEILDKPIKFSSYDFAQEQDYLSQLQKDINTPFNLVADYPIRVIFYTTPIKVGNISIEKKLVLINIHHVAFDGWSMDVFLNELDIIYSSMQQGAIPSLPKIDIQYKDYAAWQCEYLTGEVLEKQLDYWKNKLQGTETLDFPIDYPRPSKVDYKGNHYWFKIDHKLSAQLKEIAKRHKCSLYTVLLSCYYVLLNKYTGQNKIVVGVPIANRHYPQIENLIGFFVNMLAIPQEISLTMSIDNLISNIQMSLVEAQSYQDLPFERLVELLNANKDQSRHPIFQTICILQNFGEKKYSHFTRIKKEKPFYISKFDISMYLAETDNSIEGRLEYSTALFKKSTIEKFVKHYLIILEKFVEDQSRLISDYHLLTYSNHQKIIYDWNESSMDCLKHHTVHNLFERHAENVPNRIAVVYKDKKTNYSELNSKSNQLARHLLSEFRSKTNLKNMKDTFITFCLQPSENMIIAILAILKTGAAYVPISADYPLAQLKHIINDTKTKFIIVDSQTVEKIQSIVNQKDIKIIELKTDLCETWDTSNLDLSISSSDLAYVLYTSGTSGKPKGVMIEHAAVNSLLLNQTYIDINKPLSILQLASSVFDASTFEIYAALLSGGKLVIPASAQDIMANHSRLEASIRDYHINTLWLTKTLFDVIYTENESVFTGIETLIIGGEALNPKLVKQLIRSNKRPERILNGYGPTESTTFTTIFDCDKNFSNTVPIGKPMAHRKVYILDNYQQPVAVGMIGEIYIGGAGLARGYLNQPELTNQSFVKNPFSTTDDILNGFDRLYKTGDMGRWLTNGNIEYLGRRDLQIKLRGFRVELSEIGKVIESHPAIKKSVVTLEQNIRQPETKYLAAYCQIKYDPENSTDKLSFVEDWNKLYDDIYIKNDIYDFSFNTSGWNSSFTSKPIAKEDMKEWQNASVERILSFNPESIIEIGCGSGLLMYPLIKKVKSYLGFDFSKKIIDQLAKKIKKLGANHACVMTATADEQGFEQVKAVQAIADIIIINSVVQYFPNEQYLAKVIGHALTTINSGHIYLGDIRDYRLYGIFNIAVAYQQSLNYNVTDNQIIYSHAQKRKQSERELLISPEYFVNLANNNTNITSVEILPRRGHANHEMNVYRYDVILHINCQCKIQSKKKLNWMQWKKHMSLRDILSDKGSSTIAIRAYPNKRIWKDFFIKEAVINNQNLDKIILTVNSEISSMLSLEQLHQLAELNSFNLNIYLNLHEKNACLYYDLVFFKKHLKNLIWSDSERFSEYNYINNPLQNKHVQSYDFTNIKKHIKQNLPDYMWPSIYIAVESFPTTVNGKLDRAALPKCELVVATENYIAPRNELESLLSSIWQSVLNLSNISVNDSFFQIGGNSILAIQVAHQISKATTKYVAVSDIFKYDTIELLAKRVSNSHEKTQIPTTQSKNIPLSHAQERLWFIEQYSHGTNAYHIAQLLELESSVDVNLVEQALQIIANRHTVLKTIFVQNSLGAESQQVLNDPVIITHQTCSTQENFNELMEGDINRVFNLRNEYPIRTIFYHLINNNNQRYLLINCHHIAFDGWSVNLMLNELDQIYKALLNKTESQLPLLQIQYKDYANWECNHINDSAIANSLAYWKKHLNKIQTLEFPTDYSRPDEIDYSGKHFKFCIDKRIATKLRKLANELGCTLFTVLLTGFYILLSKYTGQSNIVIGAVTANRNYHQLENLMGFFVNSFVLFEKIDKNSNCIELIQSVRKHLIEAQTYQDMPFEKLVNELSMPRSYNKHPIFQITFDLQEFVNCESDYFKQLSTSEHYSVSTYDLSLFVINDREDLRVRITYATSLFKESTIERLSKHYENILDQMCQSSTMQAQDFQLITDAEYKKILYDWNNINVDYPKNLTIMNLFEQQVSKYPDDIAVIFDTQKITYCDLNSKANQLARYIIKHMKDYEKNSQDTLIALLFEPSINMIASILAVLKIGAAYVPMDPCYPKKRVEYILKETKSPLIITTTKYHAKCNLIAKNTSTSVILVDSEPYLNESKKNLSNKIDGNDLAYVLYTSGSTGVPKGVMINHKNLFAYQYFLLKFIENKGLNNQDLKGLLAENYCFDASLNTLFPPILSGGTLVLAKNFLQYNPNEFIELMKMHKINLLDLTSSMLTTCDEYIVQYPYFLLLILGGEELNYHSTKLVSRNSNITVVNQYGPTECTVASTMYEIKENSVNRQYIGRSFSGKKLYVLDENLNAVALGCVGELYIGGLGLADGYLHSLELTNKHFIENPYACSEDKKAGFSKIYKTGDKVKLHEDGIIEYLGRNDEQVKINGYRINLNEIKSKMIQFPGLDEAYIVIEKNHSAKDSINHKQIVCYYLSKSFIKNEIMIDYLANNLPQYMRPNKFIKLDQIPLSFNGKLDINSLSHSKNQTQSDNIIEPKTEIENRLCQIWQNNLIIDKVCTNANFFELGGSSILALKVAHQISQQMGIELHVNEIFKNPLIIRLAKYIEYKLDDRNTEEWNI